MNLEQKAIIILIKSAIKGTKLNLPSGYDNNKIYDIAQLHKISTMIYYGAYNCGIDENSELMMQLFTLVGAYVSICESQNFLVGNIYEAFEHNGIDYMPLKGLSIQKLYPKTGMRVMGDADILIRMEQYDKVKGIMASLGFREGVVSDHEILWHHKTMLIELHSRLIPTYNKDYYAYFGDGWQKAIKDNDYNSRYKMTSEDEFIYLFAHLAKHYRDGGIGIKHLIDLWVYRLSVENFDENYIENELDKLNLLEFYKNVIHTIEVWFNDAEENEKTEIITDYIFESGVYGNLKNKVIVEGIRSAKDKNNSMKNVRLSTVMELVFLPYGAMCLKYPVLKDKPYLLPIYWIKRWCNAIVRRKSNIKKLNVTVKEMTASNMEHYIEDLKLVGLDFNFKE